MPMVIILFMVIILLNEIVNVLIISLKLTSSRE